MSQPVFDASIPVLTEVLSVVPETKQPAAEAAASAPPAHPADPAEHLEAEALRCWDEQQWALLEQRLTERILRQLQGKIDFVLEQRIRDSMAQVLQHALDGLTGEIRSGLQETMEHIVSRAVSQELVHLQTLKK